MKLVNIFFIYFLLIFIYPKIEYISLFAQESEKMNKMSFRTWEKILDFIHSQDIKNRIWAIDTIQRLKDEKGITLLKYRLQIEFDQEVIDKILLFLESRKSPKDYFAIRTFLKSRPRIHVGGRCIKLMHSIFPNRTHRDLASMFKKKHLRIYSLMYLKSIDRTTRKEKNWFRKVFYRYDLGSYWLQFSIKQDIETMESFQKFHQKNFFTLRSTPSTYYWYVRYHHQFNIPMQIDYLKKMDIEMLKELTENRQKILLQTNKSIILSSIRLDLWVRSGSATMKRWLFINYILSLDEKSGLNNPSEWENAILILIQKESAPLFFLTMNQYLLKMKQNHIEAYQEVCKERESLKRICFGMQIKLSMKEAHSIFWNEFTGTEKEKVILGNLTKMLKLSLFQKPEFLRYILGHKNQNVQWKAILSLSKKQLIQNTSLVVAYVLTDDSSFLKSLLLSRVIEDKELAKAYEYLLD